MTLFFSGLWLLCGAAAVIFAAGAARRLTTAVVFAAGAAAAAVLMRTGRQPDLTTVAGVLLIVALVSVISRKTTVQLTAAAAGGWASVVWASLFQMQGVPFAAAIPIALVLPAVSMWMSRGSAAFASSAIYEEALVLLSVLAAVLGAAPLIAAGWQSATALNLEEKRAALNTVAVPVWTVVIMLTSVSLGGAYSLWTRR